MSTLRDRGQSTVEFALVLPLVGLLLLAVVQAGVLLRDQLLVSSAAREAAREAAVTADLERIQQAAARAAPSLGLEVQVARGPGRGDPVRVVIRAAPTKVPLVGGAVSGRTLQGEATMRLERSTVP